MEHRVLNFDLFMQEKKRETITVTVFGKEYEIPLAVPAIVPVMMARAEAEKDPTMNTIMTMRAADAMFGPGVVDEMCDKGMTGTDLAELVSKIFVEIQKVSNGDNEDDVQELSDEDSRIVAGGKREKK